MPIGKCSDCQHAWNNGVCLYKMLETHCLKGEGGFIVFFSALRRKEAQKFTLCKLDFWFPHERESE